MNHVTLQGALDHLAETDRRVGDATQPWASLAPDRDRPTSCVALGRQHLPTLSPTCQEAFSRAISCVVGAILEHFPDNIYGDLDLLAAVLAAQPSADAMGARGVRVAALQEGFGSNSPIRFRYAHDFLFGFDWARWVARDPEHRTAVGPYDPLFLAYLETRRTELLVLIDANDQKYPSLGPSQPRNPFGFSRDPQDERRLHEALAQDALIPVPAWNPRARCAWSRPYSTLRERYAEQLLIPTRS